MDKDLKVIKANYCVSIPRAELVDRCTYRVPLDEVVALGSPFAAMAASFAKAAKNARNTEGLYRCVFPEGVTGHLASANDESGFLGAIFNKSGLQAQARWIPVSNSPVAIPIDPMVLAITVAMASVNNRLSKMEKTLSEILRFLQQEKESELEGDVNSLGKILADYKFNMDSPLWKTAKLTIVSGIKEKSEGNVIFYRKQIQNALDKQKKFHSSSDVDKLSKNLQKEFEHYHLSSYLFGYASFLEVILSGNYSEDYLSHISDQVANFSIDYHMDYLKCQNILEKYADHSIQSKALKGIGSASLKIGKTIAAIPVIRRGPLDEALIAAGSGLSEHGEHQTAKRIEEFNDNYQDKVMAFAANIDSINEMCNKPFELYFDQSDLYICTQDDD